MKGNQTPPREVQVRNHELYLNNQVQREPIGVPLPDDYMEVMEEKQQQMDDINFLSVATQFFKGNEFQAFMADTQDMGEVQMAYNKMFQKNLKVDHIVCAYRVRERDQIGWEGGQDHGEHGGAKILLEALQRAKISQVAIFVTRRVGPQLGPQRFNIIRSAAEAIIQRWSTLDQHAHHEFQIKEIRRAAAAQAQSQDLPHSEGDPCRLPCLPPLLNSKITCMQRSHKTTKP